MSIEMKIRWATLILVALLGLGYASLPLIQALQSSPHPGGD